MQIYRLFEIVYVLMNEKVVTAKTLAQRFEVSQRTIYRDIEALGMAGVPVYTEKGNGGGISLLPDFILNKSLLNEKEQQEILIALQGLSKVKNFETDKVLNKLSAVFQKNTAGWLDIDFSFWAKDIPSDLFNNLKTAILERRITEFDYYSSYGKKTREITHRKIEPIQLSYKAGIWYIKGFCLGRQDLRTFKLARISKLKITNVNFSERDLSNIKPPVMYDGNYIDEKQKSPIKIKFKMTKEMSERVYEDFNPEWYKKQKDGSFIITVAWPEDEWVYGTLLSYGENLEVLEPEHIRENIKKKVKKLYGNYFSRKE